MPSLSDRLQHDAAKFLAERIERAQRAISFIEHASFAAQRDLASRSPTPAELEQVAALIALRAVEFVILAAESPSRGALRDRGTLAGFSAVREVLSGR